VKGNSSRHSPILARLPSTKALCPRPFTTAALDQPLRPVYSLQFCEFVGTLILSSYLSPENVVTCRLFHILLSSLRSNFSERTYPMNEHVFGGDWTGEKLERVRKYLQAYFTGMSEPVISRPASWMRSRALGIERTRTFRGLWRHRCWMLKRTLSSWACKKVARESHWRLNLRLIANFSSNIAGNG